MMISSTSLVHSLSIMIIRSHARCKYEWAQWTECEYSNLIKSKYVHKPNDAWGHSFQWICNYNLHIEHTKDLYAHFMDVLETSYVMYICYYTGDIVQVMPYRSYRMNDIL